MIVKEAETWDLWRGWIRLNVNDRWEDAREIIPRKSICKIEVSDKRIYRAVLGDDRSTGTISMDYDTRNELGLELGETDRFRITKVIWYKDRCDWIRFHWKHPDRAISIGFKLGFLSVCLGVLSILLYLFPYIVNGIRFIFNKSFC